MTHAAKGKEEKVEFKQVKQFFCWQPAGCPSKHRSGVKWELLNQNSTVCVWVSACYCMYVCIHACARAHVGLYKQVCEHLYTHCADVGLLPSDWLFLCTTCFCLPWQQKIVGCATVQTCLTSEFKVLTKHRIKVGWASLQYIIKDDSVWETATSIMVLNYEPAQKWQCPIQSPTFINSN